MDQFSVQPRFRMFYQGEVLVPELVPAHLIEIPEVDVFNRVLEVVGPDVVLDPLCEETPDDPIDSKEQVAEGIPKVICGAVQGDVLNSSLSEVKELGERLPTESLPSEIGSVSFSSNPVLKLRSMKGRSTLIVRFKNQSFAVPLVV